MLLLLLLATPLQLRSADLTHTFTDVKGRSIRATLISSQNDQATLLLENGQKHSISLSTLSAADQQWVRANAPAPALADPLPPGGMAFAPNWLPKAVNVRRELLESLEFYCKEAVGNTPRGQEIIPTTICGVVRWRMHIDEFIRTLPRGYNKLSERQLVHTCMPNDSLVLCCFQFKSFLDHQQAFNQMFVLIDKERRIVSVQFVDQNGKNVLWLPQPDGIREPYYNFLSLTFNGSTTKEVPYQFLRDPGLPICVKTVFRERVSGGMLNLPTGPGMAVPAYGRTYENVHWYLPAPFARAILDIVDNHRKSGAVR